jgi:GDP-L-fucose synthase
VIHLAAVTGGIHFSRTYPAKQYYDSSFIDMNMVEAACREGVEKFVALGNLFAYAGDVPIPIKEEYLFNGLPTDAHRGVGWFKRNLALLADLYYRQYKMPMVVVYSANAYGPGDTLDREHAHVIPSTIMKCFYEHELIVWGDGSPTRDFLYVEDIAEGLVLAAEKLAPPNYVNIGSGSEISIRDLVHYIIKYSDFKGKVEFDATKSGGDARRCTSSVKAERMMGFRPTIVMEEGIKKTVEWYKSKLVPK